MRRALLLDGHITKISKQVRNTIHIYYKLRLGMPPALSGIPHLIFRHTANNAQNRKRISTVHLSTVRSYPHSVTSPGRDMRRP